MSPFQALSLAMAGMLAAPAGCFMATTGLLFMPALLVLSGCFAWGPRWIARLLAASSLPLILLAWAALRHDGPAVERSARWALAMGSGLFFPSLAGVGRIAWWLSECSNRVVPLRGVLSDLSVMIRSAVPAARRVRSSLGKGRISIEEIAGSMSSSIRDAVAEPPLDAPASVSPLLPIAGFAAWLFAMAGLAGL